MTNMEKKIVLIATTILTAVVWFVPETRDVRVEIWCGILWISSFLYYKDDIANFFQKKSKRNS